jgi:hypothetical protein
MNSDPIAKNEIGAISEFVSAARASVRVGASAMAMVPFKHHVAERQRFGLLSRAPAVDLTDRCPLLVKITPPSQIGGDVWRCGVLPMRVIGVSWVIPLIICGFFR